MKIVIATPFYPPQIGVLATYAAGIESALREQGHEVVIVVLSARLPVGLRHAVYAIRTFLALRDASCVLLLDAWSAGIPACFAARLRQVPSLLRIGGDYLWEQYVERTGETIRLSEFYAANRTLSVRERLARFLTTWLLRRTSHVFFNTRFQREIWSAAYAIPSQHSSVLENYYPPHAHTSFPSKKIFISANRNMRYKNAALLETAFARVKQRHPDIELDTGTVPHGKHLERLAASYATIIPSISEVGSNIAIESVACGRPFIMSEDTGTKERLSGCGIFIDTRSQAALEDAIESMLDQDTYAQLSQKAKTHDFVRTWNDIADDILRAAHDL